MCVVCVYLQVGYYVAFAAVIGLMLWMVYESMTGEPPVKRRRGPGPQVWIDIVPYREQWALG